MGHLSYEARWKGEEEGEGGERKKCSFCSVALCVMWRSIQSQQWLTVRRRRQHFHTKHSEVVVSAAAVFWIGIMFAFVRVGWVGGLEL